MPSLSGPVNNSYFDFTSESDYCAEHEFVVEAVSNISHELGRQNSSSVCGYFIGGEFYFKIVKCRSNHNFLLVAPSFRYLSAVATYEHKYLHINVSRFKRAWNVIGW